MPLKNKDMDRKADKALEVLFAIPGIAITEYYFHDYIWLSIGLVFAINMLKLLIACANDD